MGVEEVGVALNGRFLNVKKCIFGFLAGLAVGFIVSGVFWYVQRSRQVREFNDRYAELSRQSTEEIGKLAGTVGLQRDRIGRLESINNGLVEYNRGARQLSEQLAESVSGNATGASEAIGILRRVKEKIKELEDYHNRWYYGGR
jgi:gas vesicle protein